MRTFNVILAIDSTHGLSKDNKIPWNSEEDMKHFYDVTVGHIVIMDRTMHKIIGHNLTERINLVVSENYDLDKALNESHNYPDKKVFIVGGADLYNKVFQESKYLSRIKNVYATYFYKSYDCDIQIEPFNDKFSAIDHKSITDGVIVTYVSTNYMEYNYLKLLKHIVDYGSDRNDRTGVGTKAIFAPSLKFDLSNNKIPLLTTKFVPWRTVFHELKWFLNGRVHTDYLKKHNVKIWDANIESNGGRVGPMYPWQWRHAGATYYEDDIETSEGIDQIQNIINLIRTDPHSRRILLCNWNVSDVPKGCLAPCHVLFQVFVDDDNISGLLNMRSGDVALGVPFNILSYSFLLHMIAHVTGKKALFLDLVIGDAHIYKNHMDGVAEQLKRRPKLFPTIKITKETTNIDDINIEDIVVYDYEHEPKIKFDMAI